MNVVAWALLYTPLPSLGIMYVLCYRHDLARMARPLVDRTSPAIWWSSCRYLGLVPTSAKRPQKKGGEFLPLLAIPISVTICLLWTAIPLPLAWFDLCALQACASLPLLLLLHHRIGPFPYRPYGDFLPFPRIGTRVRHLARRKAPKANAETDSASPPASSRGPTA